jgi:cytochrome c oxidase subunit 3
MAAEPMALTVAHGGVGHAREGGISNVILGMILFITSEVMFFAGLFAAYFNVRATAPGGWPPGEFLGKLNFLPTAEQPIPVVTLATILLISSSVTCQVGVWGIRAGDHRKLVRAIGVTVVLGATFLLMQAYDYTTLYSAGVRLDAGTFGTTYYTLTGFHGAHVLGGVIMLSVVLYRAMAGQFSKDHHDMVEATSIYWHFVDVVWIVLFSTLYLIPNPA